MKKIFSLFFVLLSTVVIFTGCQDKSDLVAPAAPTATGTNFTRFVAVGNSLTAGYQSGSLFESAQMYAYPKLIANQMQTTFVYPNVGDPGTRGRIEVATISPAFSSYTNPNSGPLLNATYPLPYNNLGIPGALLNDFMTAYDSLSCTAAMVGGSPNPMFNLVLRNQGGAKTTQWLQLKAQQPTFVTFWLGSNDILGHAASGGTVPFTPVAAFTALYNQAMDSLKSLNCGVAVSNILDVAITPLFTTVGGQLRLQGATHVFTSKGGVTSLVTLQNNMIILPASALVAQGYGLSAAKPLPDNVVLDSAEILNIRTVTAQYNAVIKSAAESRGFVHVDMAAKLMQIAVAYATSGGLYIDGVKFSPVFITGNLFSLDGVHPSNMGHAIVANEFITAINAKYSANIPLINVASIPGGLIFKQTPSGSISPDYTPEMFNHILF
jgi:lysophospholipase L1-like esterase